MECKCSKFDCGQDYKIIKREICDKCGGVKLKGYFTDTLTDKDRLIMLLKTFNMGTRDIELITHTSCSDICFCFDKQGKIECCLTMEETLYK